MPTREGRRFSCKICFGSEAAIPNVKRVGDIPRPALFFGWEPSRSGVHARVRDGGDDVRDDGDEEDDGRDGEDGGKHGRLLGVGAYSMSPL
jgi:hypothetical protein